MKKDQLLLIDKHEDQAQKSIENWKTKAVETTALLEFFNQLPHLKEIKTEVEVKEFLANPQAYFHKRLMMDLTTTKGPQPLPQKLAELYGLDYQNILQQFGRCRVSSLLYMVFDEETRAVSFNEGDTQKIMNAFHEYAADKLESEAIVEVRELCDLLNRHCERWSVDSSGIQVVA